LARVNLPPSAEDTDGAYLSEALQERLLKAFADTSDWMRKGPG
jgi:hypothetical protein